LPFGLEFVGSRLASARLWPHSFCNEAAGGLMSLGWSWSAITIGD
jgi:hypothetical protein